MLSIGPQEQIFTNLKRPQEKMTRVELAHLFGFLKYQNQPKAVNEA